MGLNLNKSDFRLRPLAEADGEMVRNWRNQAHIRRNMYTEHVIGREEHARWINKILTDSRSDYTIFEHQDRPIGLVGFYDIFAEHERADWAFYLGASDIVRGSGPAMECFALDYAFGSLRVHKLCCEVLAFNKAVINLHARFGFVREGLRKAHIIKNGKYEDVVELALFRDSWSSRSTIVYADIFSA